MGKTTYVNLGKVEIDKIFPSGKAVLVKRGEEKHSIPMSVLEDDTRARVVAKASSVDSFEVAEWFVTKEEIEV